MLHPGLMLPARHQPLLPQKDSGNLKKPQKMFSTIFFVLRNFLRESQALKVWKWQWIKKLYIFTPLGDGLPSMASIDVGDDDLSLMSESSDLQRARKMYADLQAMSMESATSQEVTLFYFNWNKASVFRICLIWTPMLVSFIMKFGLFPWKQGEA